MVLPTPPVSPQAPPASVSAGPVSAGPAAARPTSVHRIRTVRLQQGVSLRTAARQTGTDIRQLRLQEQETTDLRLSDLRKWQRALDVPLAELLVEPAGTLSPPIMERARMVRLMKTAAALMERAPSLAVHRMANMLVEQLLEIMPELAEVSAWHNYGQRRSLDEYGVAVERSLPDHVFESASWE